MKKLLPNLTSTLVGALCFMIFALAPNNLSAQCPDFNFSLAPAGISCDNNGTTDPSDDLFCFDGFQLAAFSAAPSQVFTASFGGVDLGTFTVGGILFDIGETACFSAFIDPVVTVVTFDNGCTYEVSAPNPGAPTCSDCEDANGNGICDDSEEACPDADDDGVCDADDICAGSDDAVDTDGDGVPDGCDECSALANLSPGDPCPSDGDDCTDDGVVGPACDCLSELIDSDDDGVCDLDDICEGSDDNVDSDGDGVPDGCDACAALADLSPGDACPSDGDDCTDDGVVSDTCECTSTPIDTPECNPNEECEVCDSSGNDTCYEYIKKVKLGCYSKWSGDNGGYGDFTNSTWDLHCGYWNGLVLKPGFNGCAYYENWGVWIDWNQDCDFDDADEFIGQACHWGSVYGQVNIPDHALSGNTTMRVSMSYDGFPGPCDNFEYGEVEDYTVNVVCGNGHGPLDAISAAEQQAIVEAQNQFIVDEQADAMLRPGFVGTDVDRMPRIDLAKDLDGDAQLLIYPNPAVDFVNISINAELENGVVSVYDNVGRMVYQLRTGVDQAVIAIDISDYSAGLYNVSVEGDNVDTMMKKFAVTK